MAVVEVTIVPLGTGETSLSQYVADCHHVINKYNVTFQLTPMSTVFEGDLDFILKIIKEMHEIPFDKGVMRVSTTIKIDDRRDKNGTIEQKINSVKEKL
ncbi:MAG: MTH1187 family thiamine-binding protein [Clostridiales bacterium]|nr:MTH1187 family thiamine-binding protein [Clostridiales bacterium]